MAESNHTSYQVTWRDRLAHRLANAALRLATPKYRAFVERSARRGAHSLIADALAEAAHRPHGGV